MSEVRERRRAILGASAGLVLTAVAAWFAVSLGNGWVAEAGRADEAGTPARAVTGLDVAVFLFVLFALVTGVMLAAIALLRHRPAGPPAPLVPRTLWLPIGRSAAVGVLLGVFAGPLAGFVAFVLLGAIGVLGVRRPRRET